MNMCTIVSGAAIISLYLSASSPSDLAMPALIIWTMAIIASMVLGADRGLRYACKADCKHVSLFSTSSSRSLFIFLRKLPSELASAYGTDDTHAKLEFIVDATHLTVHQG